MKQLFALYARLLQEMTISVLSLVPPSERKDAVQKGHILIGKIDELFTQEGTDNLTVVLAVLALAHAQIEEAGEAIEVKSSFVVVNPRKDNIQ